jgi:hypothetical protein
MEEGYSYPAGLEYATSAIRAWSVATTRLTPESISDAEPNSYVRFQLPESQLCQLSSFAVFGDVVGITGGGDEDQVIFPRNSMSFIDQLTVEANGSVISNIVGYNHVHKLFSDMQHGNKHEAFAPIMHTRNFNPIGGLTDNGFDKNDLPMIGVSQNQVLSGPQGVKPTQVPTVANTDFFERLSDVNRNFAQNALPMCWANFLSFMSCGKWLDVSTIGNVTVTIKFASDRILKRYAGAATNGTPPANGKVTDNKPTYRIKNLRAFINTGSVDDGVLYQVLQQRLSQAPLQIPFKRFVTFNTRPLTGTGSVNFSVATMSLDAVYSMLLNPNPLDRDALASEVCLRVVNPTGQPNTDPTLDANTAVARITGQSSIFPGDNRAAPYFARFSAGVDFESGRVLSTQMRLNSVAYPAWPANVDEQYYLALNTFRHFDDDTVAVCPEMTYENWHGDLSFFSYRLSYGKGLEFTSGMDTRGVNTSGVIEYVISPPNPGSTPSSAFNLRPFVICETTSMLLVGAYRSTSIIP